MSEKVLSKEQCDKVRQVMVTMHIVPSICNSHEALRAERDAALAEVERLKAQATYWYEGDGTVTTHSAEAVKARRIAAAKELVSLRAEVERLRAGLESIVALCKGEPFEGQPTYLPGGAQAAIILEGSDRPLQREREKSEALRAEVDSLRAKHDAKVDRINALEAEVERMRPVVERANEWRCFRMEYEALSASVQQRFADAGRPSGYSAWTEDEKMRHTDLLGAMLSKLKELEQAIDRASAQKEGKP